MKIQTILEKAKFAKQKTIAFHGTSKKNLESIIKNGLIINHNDTGLGSGEYDERGFGYSFAPHEGVYLSTNWINAVNSAKNVDRENPIVIIAQVQMKGSYLDEDDIFDVLKIDDMRILNNVNRAGNRYGYDSDEYLRALDNLSDVEYEIAVDNLADNLAKEYGINQTSIKHIVDNAKPHIRKYIDNLITGASDNTGADIREQQDALRKLLKNVTRQHDIKYAGKGDNTNFAIPHNIGFKGANKIIGICDLNADKLWGYHPSAQHFDRVKTPAELLK